MSGDSPIVRWNLRHGEHGGRKGGVLHRGQSRDVATSVVQDPTGKPDLVIESQFGARLQTGEAGLLDAIPHQKP
jgi:hypothetical protein